MRQKKSVVKENGEKLLRLFLMEEGGIIDSVKLTGDFFLYPEEGVDAIERSLAGVPCREKEIVDAVITAMKENSIEMVGLSPQSIARAILQAR